MHDTSGFGCGWPQSGALAGSRLSVKLLPVKAPRTAGVPRGAAPGRSAGAGVKRGLRDLARAFPVKDTSTNEEEGLLQGERGLQAEREDQGRF